MRLLRLTQDPILGEARRCVADTPYGLLTTITPERRQSWLSTVYPTAHYALHDLPNIPENNRLRESYEPLRLVMSYGCGHQVGHAKHRKRESSPETYPEPGKTVA